MILSPRAFIVALAFMASLASCSGPKQEGAAGQSTDSAATAGPAAPDTLAYAIDSVTARDPGCPANAKPEDCTRVRILFPDLAGSGASVQLVANILRDVTLSTGLVQDTAKHLPTLEHLSKAFVDSFVTEKNIYLHMDPEAKAFPWYLDVTSRLTEASGLVFLTTQAGSYTGGAHGYDATRHRAYDRRSGAPVSLDNLLQDKRAATQLERLAEAQFRRQENLTASQSYKAYFFEKGRFDLPRNWRIYRDTLEFIYNPYEIKPYAAGSTRLALPLTAVDSLFTPAYRRKAA